MSTSAPERSHRRATVFMKLIRVASMALAAYFVTSADAVSMTRISLPVRTKGMYRSRSTSAATESSTPSTTRSGRLKSLIAAPSFRNSGLQQTCTGCSVSASIASRTILAVPTGTVLFVITMRSPSIARPTSRAAARTWRRSADPSSPGGVPTAMKTM